MYFYVPEYFPLKIPLRSNPFIKTEDGKGGGGGSREATVTMTTLRKVKLGRDYLLLVIARIRCEVLEMSQMRETELLACVMRSRWRLAEERSLLFFPVRFNSLCLRFFQ